MLTKLTALLPQLLKKFKTHAQKFRDEFRRDLAQLSQEVHELMVTIQANGSSAITQAAFAGLASRIKVCVLRVCTLLKSIARVAGCRCGSLTK